MGRLIDPAAPYLRTVNAELIERLQRSAARGSTGLTALAVLTGLGAGAGAVAFRYLILGFTHLFTGHRDYSAAGHALNPLIPGLGIWFVVAAPVIGGLIYGPLVARFAPEARGHGVPEVMLAVHRAGGRIPRSGAINDQRDSRFASIITVLILLATLLLLGFSVYLAAELNFIHIPGLGAPNAAPTNPVVQFPVPDLKNLSYQDAKIRATGAGFNIDVPDNITTGVVVSQDPAPPALAPKGSNIRLKFGPAAQQTVTVPDGLVGNSLTNAELILRNAGIKWTIQPDGNNPSQAANTVSRVLPTSGSSIPKGSAVILYVVNYTNGSPAVTPSPSSNPSPSPTQDPTAKPTQDPTAKPSPSPSPSPTPIVTPPTVTTGQ